MEELSRKIVSLMTEMKRKLYPVKYSDYASICIQQNRNIPGEETDIISMQIPPVGN